MSVAEDLLRSIDASLRELVALSRQRAQRGGGAAAGPAVASERDLRGKYGDPEVRFEPRDWSGATMKGRKFSECQPEFLEMLAEMFDHFAKKAEETNETTDKGKPVAPYKRLDAARARGWAGLIREGKHTPPPAETAPAWAGGEGF